ncbi:hypothetical protein RMS29_022795 [Agrobacterium rosae]|uniref:Uncharacterized protein n=1 Tax=Agrobacterium rosae TaxID=1972867 RepID=A0AAE5VQG4_9HYPH|nr:hypothetical protein [Agrobacterium rosae]KAA3509562.1 hypothetical protein DXM21_21035 [Agrobacterium rosae]MCM2434976.1 hypothetical protein [Agrobacterium rosae]MDX8304882.1 hypothetical protein [Agrobacterium rosae]MDX8330802.1 hypothetical protein [Agrobacterium rosae]MQB50260.1 hypothetical protein [Agrobacterium rosae]
MELEMTLLRYAGASVIFAIFIVSYFMLMHARRASGLWRRCAIILLTYTACVGLAIAGATAVSWYIEWRIASYNPKEPWWMNSTVPPGYEYLLDMWIRDTGRAMVFITAPVFTPPVMLSVYIFIVLQGWFCKLINRTYK